jgi:very-short-patch-repair endonuclease
MTEPEILLWSRLKDKQILGLQFYRQKPLLSYIVDFYCHQTKLVIECDGSQHFEDEYREQDQNRDRNLAVQGILVLRFDNPQIMTQLNSVMECIWNASRERQGRS